MLEERVELGNGFCMEVVFRSTGDYRLSCLKGKNLLVEYQGDGNRHHRSLQGRGGAYEFRSVEQLRYDFERDAGNAQRQG